MGSRLGSGTVPAHRVATGSKFRCLYSRRLFLGFCQPRSPRASMELDYGERTAHAPRTSTVYIVRRIFAQWPNAGQREWGRHRPRLGPGSSEAARATTARSPDAEGIGSVLDSSG